MAIDQRMLAEYLRRQQQQGMSIGRPPITMESQVNALANQPLAPGMVGAYVDQSKPDPRAKSFAGEDNRIKSQRAMANMLRGKEAPKGKTVGPYDLYMGPNWGESLAYAGEQALGGYMAGKANRDDIALDEEKGLVKAATLAAEDEEKARQAAFEQAKLDQKTTNDAAQLAVSRGNLGVNQNRLFLDRNKQTFTQGVMTPGFMQPIDPEGGDPVPVLRDASGITWNVDPATDKPTTPFDRRGYINLDTAATGSTSAAQSLADKIALASVNQEGRLELAELNQEGRLKLAEYQAALAEGSELSKEEREEMRALKKRQWNSQSTMDKALAVADSTMNAFTRPLLDEDIDRFSGLLSIPRVLAKGGMGGKAWKGQSVDQQLKAGATALIGDLAAIFKPMSDSDLKLLLSQFPSTAYNEPETITAWLGTVGRDTLEKNYREARADLLPEQQKRMDEVWGKTRGKIDAAVASAAMRQEIPTTEFRSLGFNSEAELKFLYSQIAKRQGL